MSILLTIGFIVLMFYMMRMGGGCCGGHFHGRHMQHRSNEHTMHREKHIDSFETAKDPVCGMYVTKTNSIKRTINGYTYYFCSRECEEKFIRMQ